MREYHVPVMLYEALEHLNIKKDGVYVDCTLGGGGHSLAIAERLGKDGVLVSIDCDQEALDFVDEKSRSLKILCDWKLVKGNFSELDDVLRKNSIDKVDGVLFDLGVSSHQLDEEKRGFSFRKNAELDMRMDRNLSLTAQDLVNGLYKKELENLLRTFGEEPFAGKIAGAIVKERDGGMIKTTEQLNKIIQKVVPFKTRKKSAMRVFQALRIAVNDEISNLQSGLPQALEALAPQGKCVVISFHSLEDRIVKKIFNESARSELGRVITKRPIQPSEQEIRSNPRSRSAKLRVFEKAA